MGSWLMFPCLACCMVLIGWANGSAAVCACPPGSQRVLGGLWAAAPWLC